MPTALRLYQEELKAQVYRAWQEGHQNILMQLPTGGGKTKLFCNLAIEIVNSHKYPTAIFVHRKELVQQISLTLAEEGITHNIIAPRNVILGIVAAHRRILQRQFYDYNAPISVVSVDTLNARIHKHEKWTKTVKFWITDEAAHLLKNNKWGKAVDNFPNAIGLGVTATPRRLDKKGLGRDTDGVFDTMVEGPNARWLIEHGFLCRYKIAIPPSDYQQFLRKASESSDYSKEAMNEADRRSVIYGHLVKNYLKFARGKQTIVFVSSIETAEKAEKEYKDAGIKAKLLTGFTNDKERLDAMLDFRDKKIQVLLNVDLFDEGLDVPGIECVQLGRATMSLSKYLQMCGRGLRPAKDKEALIIIDHVGNVTRHGLPDARRIWSLDRVVKKQDKTNFIRICSNIECNAPYDRTLTECPWCGTKAISGESRGGRVAPEMVDGDLELLDQQTLMELESKTQLDDPAVVGKRVSFAAGGPAGIKAMKAQVERIDTQKTLVGTIAKWAGKMKHHGYTDRMIHKAFFLEFSRTISEALSEPRAEMLITIENLVGKT